MQYGKATPDDPAPVLVATGDVPYLQTISNFLEHGPFEVTRAPDAAAVLRLSGRMAYDVVVLDVALNEGADVELVSYIRQRNAGAHVILLFEVAQLERALEGLRQGAFFYLPKSAPPSDVALVVEKAVRHLNTHRQMGQYEQSAFIEFIGTAPAMQRVVEMIRKVAPTDSTVLLLGESGTGKEVMANAIHRLSDRREQPFIAINCAALPEGLLESEMFGHVRGAFTGAERDKTGLFEEADGGTLFLDEIGEMAALTQAKLLRVLQNGEIRPVGAAQGKRVDVRVIAATNRDLAVAVRENTFREDLYFRLNVFTISIPPLRDRREALPALIGHFLSRYAARYGKTVQGFDDTATALLNQYSYPGNVRELESIVSHAVIMAEGEHIHSGDLPERVQRQNAHRPALPYVPEDRVATLDEVEAAHIQRVLDQMDGNQTNAAKALGISRSTLWRKLKQYGLAPATSAE